MDLDDDDDGGELEYWMGSTWPYIFTISLRATDTEDDNDDGSNLLLQELQQE